jgi:predicted regulator of Ras-like GTPase activity (Roadblock/LC7/MglB family)
VTDDIRALSEALAADPSSTVFLRLGEMLRRAGQLELANRVATRGLERHSRRPETHDLLARVALDRGDLSRAKSAWERVLTMEPGHAGALKGLGFLSFQQGDLDSATRLLGAALAADPDDSSVATALGTVLVAAGDADGAATVDARAAPAAAGRTSPMPPFSPQPADASTLFAEVLGDGPQTALLLDGDGYVVAGQYVTADGRDVAGDIGAQLSGVGDEAGRAMRHLAMGEWRQIVFETEAASVAMAPSGAGVLLVAAPRAVPLGFVRRLLERALERARRWIESGT